MRSFGFESTALEVVELAGKRAIVTGGAAPYALDADHLWEL